VLLLAGVLCLIYFRPLSDFLAAFFAKQFHDAYGQYATDRGWDNPGSSRNKYFYRAATLFIAIFLLIMAFHAFFGTIYLNR
jgi:hypothetical protein